MTINNLPTYTNPNSITRGFIFECSCGERFKTIQHAAWCKKCRTYSVWGTTKYVINIETDEVVYGEIPSDEEYQIASDEAEKRWEEERLELEKQTQMWLKEGEIYEAEMEKQRQERLKVEAEQEEDRVWDVQDKLMK
jgi:hypothetical protein